jgi:hypothetical protein
MERNSRKITPSIVPTTNDKARGVRSAMKAATSRSCALFPPTSSVPSATEGSWRMARTTPRASALSGAASASTYSRTICGPTIRRLA